MFPRNAHREEIFLDAVVPEPGVYAIRPKWTALVGYTGRVEMFGPTLQDNLSLQEALILGVIALKEPRQRLANDFWLGYVGIVGDVMGWDHDGLIVRYRAAGTEPRDSQTNPQ